MTPANDPIVVRRIPQNAGECAERYDEKFGAFCHLYETGEVPGEDERYLHTSAEARAFAAKAMEIVDYYGEWE